jgi:hypothetical protein
MEAQPGAVVMFPPDVVIIIIITIITITITITATPVHGLDVLTIFISTAGSVVMLLFVQLGGAGRQSTSSGQKGQASMILGVCVNVCVRQVGMEGDTGGMPANGCCTCMPPCQLSLGSRRLLTC